ncbi:hypothetical protein D0867_02139 [Hortaea werneckii]|uniref:Uncharacterized protein n=1 Tax=Hortaea werneckii TaxID=91943 RepID=A0A3M7A6Y6_HORWE|nr:hypothetical protein D0867_02139 [Hortaea werneckii]RMY35776.1 hypothetical protein D0866_04373 [Hortaea werneckii]
MNSVDPKLTFTLPSISSRVTSILKRRQVSTPATTDSKINMQLQKNLWLLAGLAALAYAQDDSECDPQNDDNNNATCTSSSMATMTSSAAAQSTTQTTTDSQGSPLVQTVPVETNTNTNVVSDATTVNSNIQSSFVPIVQTVSSSVSTTLVPESLATSYSQAISTELYSSSVPLVINTLSDGSVSTSTRSMTSSMTSSMSGGSGGAAGADSSSSSSESESDSGAMPTGAPKYALGGVAAAVFGLAAGL